MPLNKPFVESLLNLEGKVILVTGASSGIGRECALLLNELGATVVLVARDLGRLQKTAEEFRGGAPHFIFSHDITDYEKNERILEAAVAEAGKISGFIHSAGIERTLPFRNTRPQDFINILAPNVIAGFDFARLISQKKYLADGGGSFVFVASVMGRLGQSGKIGYCASKGAVIAGAKAMAMELAAKHIRVNSVLPGVVLTELTEKMFEELPAESRASILKQHPLGFGDPSDVASACAFLLSHRARWITGSELTVDGGYSAH